MHKLDSSKQFLNTLERMSSMNASQGIFHAIVHGVLLIGLGSSTIVFWQHDVSLAFLLMIPLAIVYTAVLVTTHDCVHKTYTGVQWFDSVWPRIWSWIIYWPFCTYKELHLLHHEMLGSDYDDPERCTFLKSEFDRSSRLKRWYIRNQWLINIFVLGGFGVALKQWKSAKNLSDKYPQLKTAMHHDKIGILSSLTFQVLIVLYFNVLLEYLVSFVLLERIVGGFMQLRLLAEHYGLWEGRHGSKDVRLAMSSRNIKCGWFARWIFNDLCFHSVHHVYPQIPWYKLGEAHLILPGYWEGMNSRMIEPKDSYVKTMIDGVRSWRLLPDR